MSSLRRDLRWALDPVAFAVEALGLVPDEWQANVLRSPSKRLILLCSRQAGKSTVAAILAIHQAVFVPGSLTLVVSPSLRQSVGELGRRISGGLDRLEAGPRSRGGHAAHSEARERIADRLRPGERDDDSRLLGRPSDRRRSGLRSRFRLRGDQADARRESRSPRADVDSERTKRSPLSGVVRRGRRLGARADHRDGSDANLGSLPRR